MVSSATAWAVLAIGTCGGGGREEREEEREEAGTRASVEGGPGGMVMGSGGEREAERLSDCARGCVSCGAQCMDSR